jgi:carbamoyltransferase
MYKNDDLKTAKKFEIGVSGYFHDSSVALFQDGMLIDFVKEEDVLRVKGASGFPYKSLEYLRDQYQLDNTSINSICFYEKPLKSWLFILRYLLKNKKVSKNLLKKHLQNFWDGPLSFERNFQTVLKVDRSKIYYSDHHASHIMSAIPFIKSDSHDDKFLNFTFDAFGDGLSSTISVFENGKLNIIHHNEFPNSLGLFYSAFTQYCGFLPNEGEYKLMALSGYGEPKYADLILSEMINVDGPNYKLNLDYFSFDTDETKYFSPKFANLFDVPAGSEPQNWELGSERFRQFGDIASSAQAVLETVMTATIEWAVRKTGIRNITISGGVAQNCLAISAMAQSNLIDSIIVPPSPGDSGAAIGAVNFVRAINGNSIIKVGTLAFGQRADQIIPPDDLFELNSDGDFINVAAQLIDKGEIIAIFDGRRELGPRALGYRSIVCDAGNFDVISQLNSKIKKREEFRPLAPVALEIYADELFEIDPKLRKNFNWMGAICFAKPNFDDRYRGALHVDRSARLQIISDQSSLLYQLAKNIDTKLLINTSFNIASDPIVFDFIDVFVNMERMGLRYLLTPTGLFKLKRLDH